MSSSSPAVSIFLPVKNGGEYLPMVLDQVFSQETSHPFEVVAIDSGSTDDSVKILKEHGVRLYQIPPEEFNHGRTRNQGIEKCNGEFVIVMSQDAIPIRTDWLETMLRNFEDPAVAGVYCKHQPSKDADILIKRRVETYFGSMGGRHVKYLENTDDYEKLTPHEKFRLCIFDDVCACLRRSVWKIHKYDEMDFAEDLGWSKKVLLAGYKIVYEPEAAVEHSHLRSVLSEYREIYECHKQLYRLFGLQSLPALGGVLRCYKSGIIEDARYVWAHGENARRKMSAFAKLPFRSFLRLYAEYKAVKDLKREEDSRVAPRQ
jgi:rhamnosyltransferase